MCNFSIPITGSVDDMIIKAQTAITIAGGAFDKAKQTFSIPLPISNVSGTYTVGDATIDIVITHRPPLVSCQKIQDELNQRL